MMPEVSAGGSVGRDRVVADVVASVVPGVMAGVVVAAVEVDGAV